MSHALELVLILLASAVLVVVVFRTLHLPPLLGYLIVGVAIGPHALGWIAEDRNTAYLGEFGVVFLMFTIGLEFSLPKLVQMRRLVLGLGGLQVVLTTALFTALLAAAGSRWQGALALGAALAMSSTAIVVRMLAERMQTETPHGREVIGVLLAQDLAVVPLLVLVPALARAEGELAGALGLAALKAAVILGAVLWLGQKLMPSWFHLVAKRRSHELFIINVLFITLASAYLTELAGLSLALGAFVAGVLISETQYRHQVEEDIKPFREVLLGLFFITVGMQLDLARGDGALRAGRGDVRRAARGEVRDRRRPVAPARRDPGDRAAERARARAGGRVRPGARRARRRARARSTRRSSRPRSRAWCCRCSPGRS